MPADLIVRLLGEMEQSEQWLIKRCRAKRLEQTPPDRALRAMAEHAAHMLPLLRLHRPEAPADGIARTLESIASNVVGGWLDRIRPEESSYRATLLGARRGYDVALLLRHAAITAHREDIEQLGEEWLAGREMLLVDATRALAWYADLDRRHMVGACGS